MNIRLADNSNSKDETQRGLHVREEPQKEMREEADKPGSKSSTSVGKRARQMLAELHRLRKQMKEAKESIERPIVSVFCYEGKGRDYWRIIR